MRTERIRVRQGIYMRFMTRSLLGIAILGLTLGLLITAGSTFFSALREQAESNGRRGPSGEERVYSVAVDTLSTTTVAPVITAFGEVESWRQLELRAETAGRVVDLSDGFRDGGRVDKGSLLYQIDPTDAEADLDLARTEVREAKAELLEAEAALALADGDWKAATEQRELRQAALSRQQDLKERGVGTDAAIETAALSLSSAKQAELAKEQARAQAEARILRADINWERQEIAAAEARRRLDETSAIAPFTGVLSEVSARTGRLVGGNEKLGVLIDPAALEVAFRVSNAQFARLIDRQGRVRPVDVMATLDLDGMPLEVTGRIDRAGAEVGDGQTGRQIYARLDTDDETVLRPGDFLRVDISEPALEGVSVIPASASSSAGELLLVGPDDRLEAAVVTILRRQADSLIIKDAPIGRDYVLRLQPQLGAGVKIKATRPGGEIVQQKLVRLTPERRAALIAFVEANTRMPKRG